MRRDKVFVASVPQIEGLTFEDLLEYARGKQALLKYIPDERDCTNLDRKWLCDIIYSVDKASFERLIQTAVKNRGDRLDTSRSMIVEMSPEFAVALNSSLNFSGKSKYKD